MEVEPGVRLEVQDVGSGRPVVFIPGFAMTHETFDREVLACLEAGYRTVCVNLRGTGGSDKPLEGHCIERHSLDVQAVIDELRIEEATLVGWSYGGQIGFHVCGTAPARAAQLVLLSSNGVRASRSGEFPFGGPGDRMAASMIAAERADKFAARRKAIRSGFPRDAEVEPALLEYLLRIHLQQPSYVTVQWYESYLNEDLTHLIDAVRVPVLQLFGELDVVTPVEGAEWVRSRLADSRIVSLPGVSHYPGFEDPAAECAALLEFLAEV